MNGDFLQVMARASRERLAEARAREPLEAVRDAALTGAAPPALRLHADGFDIIAEIKLTSPAAGVLAAADTPIAPRALAYAEAGAAAVSVLTEPTRFGGALAHLAEAAQALQGSGALAMRKDFLVDAYQIYEARRAGAGGVLLIIRMLDDEALGDMLAAAAECGLFVLLEAFDRDDLQRAATLLRQRGVDPRQEPMVLIGLNARDLRTLDVDTARFAGWRDDFPPGAPAVAESGLEAPQDVAAVAELGYELALIGSALMRQGDPAALLRDLLRAGRGHGRALRSRRGETVR